VQRRHDDFGDGVLVGHAVGRRVVEPLQFGESKLREAVEPGVDRDPIAQANLLVVELVDPVALQDGPPLDRDVGLLARRSVPAGARRTAPW
jgi:hypothetical protein